MNYSLLGGIFFVMLFFSMGVKMHLVPGNFNSTLGYRTSASKKNEETWYSANMYAGRCLMLLAVLLVLVLILLESMLKSRVEILTLIVIYFLIGSVAVYTLTERYLRKIFFRDGKRRPSSF